MTPKLVIFDCDGVLVDTEPTTDRVLSANLSSHGLHIAQSEVHSLFAGGTMQGAMIAARARGANLPDDWLDEVYEQVFAALEQGVPVIAGVVDLLEVLDNAGVATAIASNGPMAKMQISLGPSGLWAWFAGRIYSGHDFRPKPGPEMLQHAMQMAGATPAETVMIDDTAAGWKAARAAGVRGLAYVADGRPVSVADGEEVITDMAQVAGALGL